MKREVRSVIEICSDDVPQLINVPTYQPVLFNRSFRRTTLLRRFGSFGVAVWKLPKLNENAKMVHKSCTAEMTLSWNWIVCAERRKYCSIGIENTLTTLLPFISDDTSKRSHWWHSALRGERLLFTCLLYHLFLQRWHQIKSIYTRFSYRSVCIYCLIKSNDLTHNTIRKKIHKYGH